MTYYKKDGYVVDAKEIISYSSPIFFLERPKEYYYYKRTL
jgi:hypothetical protein